MNSRRSSIGATTPLKLRPRSSVETPPNNFVIDTGSLEDGIEERKIVMADDTVIGSERVYRMFRPDPGLYGTDVMEDPFSSAGKELQTFHLVTYILQLSDELSPLYGYFCDTSSEDHLPRSIDDIIHNLPIRDLEGEAMNYSFNGREVAMPRFEMGMLRAVASFIQHAP